jgi:hypothetical protein
MSKHQFDSPGCDKELRMNDKTVGKKSIFMAMSAGRHHSGKTSNVGCCLLLQRQLWTLIRCQFAAYFLVTLIADRHLGHHSTIAYRLFIGSGYDFFVIQECKRAHCTNISSRVRQL